ncbi:MAG: RHO alpha subunit C-terminal catalytic domain-containing protein, partial [Paracoccaceae bacterium]|nr:RHO alpha subunit C-terminal catalytic domain-containing protein [Paracoccaceae bacterium]
PNTLLGVQRDHCFAIVLKPFGPTRTVEEVALFYATEGAAFGDDFAGMRKEMAERWYEVFDEDVWAVEGMQRGRHTVKYDGGKFSPAMDGPTHCFHHWVASQIVGQQLAAE